jgi:sugar/nucleoside kinase (ribokinase family)
VLVCCLGDLLLDVVVRLDHPLAPGDDATARTGAGAGGQAANVAAWSAALGAEARLVACRADDHAGRLVASEAADRGVEVVGPVLDGVTGTVVSLVGPDGDRTMASDRGIAPALDPDSLEPRWFIGAGVLHLSGYSLMREPIAAAAARAATLARAAGARITVDLSSATHIERFGAAAFRARLTAVAPDLVFGTEREHTALGDAPAAPAVVVKRGPAGLAVHGPDGRIELPAEPGPVVDATGAGDALAAGVLVGLLEGRVLEEAARAGLRTAARCVAQPGAMP